MKRLYKRLPSSHTGCLNPTLIVVRNCFTRCLEGNERAGEDTNRGQVKQLLRMLSELGMYAEHFEVPFLQQTNLFYETESTQYLEQGEISASNTSLQNHNSKHTPPLCVRACVRACVRVQLGRCYYLFCDLERETQRCSKNVPSAFVATRDRVFGATPASDLDSGMLINMCGA